MSNPFEAGEAAPIPDGVAPAVASTVGAAMLVVALPGLLVADSLAPFMAGIHQDLTRWVALAGLGIAVWLHASKPISGLVQGVARAAGPALWLTVLTEALGWSLPAWVRAGVALLALASVPVVLADRARLTGRSWGAVIAATGGLLAVGSSATQIAMVRLLPPGDLVDPIPSPWLVPMLVLTLAAIGGVALVMVMLLVEVAAGIRALAR